MFKQKKDSSHVWLYSGDPPKPFQELKGISSSFKVDLRNGLMKEMEFFTDLAKSSIVQIDPSDIGEPGIRESLFRLTYKAYERLQELRKTTDSKQAFVAMWFDPQMDSAFKAIKEACEHENFKYKAYRVDNDQHNENITNKIIAEIRRSKFLIAELTGNRGGVYWEAGFAYGLGKEVIYCMRKADFDDPLTSPHFDVKQIAFILWEDEEDLKKKLIDRIGATVV